MLVSDASSGVLLPNKYGTSDLSIALHKCSKSGIGKRKTLVKQKCLKKKSDFKDIWKKLQKNCAIRLTQWTTAPVDQS